MSTVKKMDQPRQTRGAVSSGRRVLITGINGFVGAHLERCLLERGFQVCGFDQHSKNHFENVYTGNITDHKVLLTALGKSQPDIIFHLAGTIKSTQPELLYQTNFLGTIALFDCLMETQYRPMVLISSSSAVYGAGRGSKPISETFKPRPLTHYAVSKLAQETAALRYFDAFHIPVIIARAFNLLGPGQPPNLAFSSFARQIALAEIRGSGEIITGDLSAHRDFLDVRDAAQALIQMAEEGAAGQIYNVCSGRAVSIQKCLKDMLASSSVHLKTRRDVKQIQHHDIPIQVGTARKLKESVGWQPEISLHQSLSDLLDDWRRRAKVEMEQV